MVDNMKDIEQLTQTTVSSIAGVVPEVWSKDVEEAAKPLRVARNYVRVNEDLKAGGDIIHIPKRGKLTASNLSESGTIDPSELTYDTVDLQPKEIGAGVSVKKKAVKAAQTDILSDATYELGESLAQKEDTDILGTIATGTANVIYGGDATGTADLESVDTLTPAKFIEAVNEVRKKNFSPDVAIISPESEYHLGTWDQFLSAAKWGDTGVREEGVTGARFFGVDIVVSDNLPSGIGGVGTNVAYHKCLFMEGARAGVIAIKSDPEVETDYQPLGREHDIAATMEYDVDILNQDAVCVGVFAD